MGCFFLVAAALSTRAWRVLRAALASRRCSSHPERKNMKNLRHTRLAGAVNTTGNLAWPAHSRDDFRNAYSQRNPQGEKPHSSLAAFLVCTGLHSVSSARKSHKAPLTWPDRAASQARLARTADLGMLQVRTAWNHPPSVDSKGLPPLLLSWLVQCLWAAAWTFQHLRPCKASMGAMAPQCPLPTAMP